MNRTLTSCLLAVSGGLAGCVTQTHRVVLDSVDFDRAGMVVHFPLPQDTPSAIILQDNAGQPIAVQVDKNEDVTFFVPFQKAGEKLAYTIEPLAGNNAVGPEKVAGALATSKKEDGRLRFEVNHAPVFYYQMDLAKPPREGIADKILRGGFLYPIYTPKGVQVADSYPVDHPHDHGIWTAWASSQFQGRHVDFWNPHYAYGGTVEFVGLDRTWDGSVDAGFESRHRSIDRTVTPNVAALNEQWKVTLYAAPDLPARLFDLEFTQTPATADPLEVEKYIYGGLGVRGHAQWEDKKNMWILTSEGTIDRVQANNQPARWVFIGGNIDGSPAGIAVLSAPTNFRAPQTVRMNPDGPFFMYAPVITAGFTITKEQPYIAHYRFIVQDGRPDAKFLEACWQGFAHPATATVEAR